jgi:hypothetical protein
VQDVVVKGHDFRAAIWVLGRGNLKQTDDPPFW